jgi:hypothetical protein
MLILYQKKNPGRFLDLPRETPRQSPAASTRYSAVMPVILSAVNG